MGDEARQHGQGQRKSQQRVMKSRHHVLPPGWQRFTIGGFC